MNNISITGYKDNSPHSKRSHNIIPGNLITMDGVSKTLTLIPIVNGVPQYDRRKIAKPGDPDIQFEQDVESVLELPNAQVGDLTRPSGLLKSPLNIPPVDSSLEGISTFDNAYPSSYFTTAPTILPPTIQDIQEAEQYKKNQKDKMGEALELQEDFNVSQKKVSDQITNDNGSKKTNGAFISPINPYGGWNMENTATALGAFAQDKNALGVVGASGKLLLSGARNALSGAGAYKILKEASEEKERDIIEEQNNARRSNLQKGGKVEKMMTGNFIEGNENHTDPNIEVEKGEYLQTPDGQTMEVIGKKHSEGGELLNVPDSTKVVSDYLKIGSKLATELKKDFGLNLKHSNSFATVIDKYKKKIGLDALIEDQEEIFKKINKQNSVEFEGTRSVNMELLTNKLKEIESTKKELENELEVFTNYIFDKQEESKQHGEYNFKKQMGGEVDSQQIPAQDDSQQQGGDELEQIILMYSDITKQDPAEIINQLQQLDDSQLEQVIAQMVQTIQSGNPQEEGGTNIEQEGEEQIEYAQKGIKVGDFSKILESYSWDPTYKRGDLKKQAERLKPILDELGIKYEEKQLSTQDGQDALAGVAQKKFTELYPETSKHYSSKVAPTQKGLQTALDKGLVTEKELKDLGVKIKDNKILVGSQEMIPKENIDKLITLLNNKRPDNEQAYKGYVDSNFVDNKWFYRFADIKDINFDTEEELNSFLKNGDYKKIEDSNGKTIYSSNKTGLYFNPITNKISGNKEAVSEGSKDKDPSTVKTPPAVKNNSGMGTLPLMVPDQSNLPPNLLQPSLRTVGSYEATPIYISPEDTIRELNRQYNTASTLITENNPYTAGAAMANLQSQTNDAINKAYYTSSMANAQDRRNVENLNEERISKRDIYNTGRLDAYEKAAQDAQDNFISSWRNHIDKKNLEGVNNWNLQNQVNTFNAINPNYKINSLGQVIQTEDPNVFYYNGSVYKVDPTTKDVKKAEKTEENKNSTGAKKGGLLLSKGIKKYLK